MAANDWDLSFISMTEAELRQWVEANPGRVNDRDTFGCMPLSVAVVFIKSVPLVLWLVKERGADVNAADGNGYLTPLHRVRSLDVLDALLDCGADPTLVKSSGLNPHMLHCAPPCCFD